MPKGGFRGAGRRESKRGPFPPQARIVDIIPRAFYTAVERKTGKKPDREIFRMIPLERSRLQGLSQVHAVTSRFFSNALRMHSRFLNMAEGERAYRKHFAGKRTTAFSKITDRNLDYLISYSEMAAASAGRIANGLGRMSKLFLTESRGIASERLSAEEFARIYKKLQRMLDASGRRSEDRKQSLIRSGVNYSSLSKNVNPTLAFSLNENGEAALKPVSFG